MHVRGNGNGDMGGGKKKEREEDEVESENGGDNVGHGDDVSTVLGEWCCGCNRSDRTERELARAMDEGLQCLPCLLSSYDHCHCSLSLPLLFFFASSSSLFLLSSIPTILLPFN